VVIHLDSAFLIDLMRETSRERPEGAFHLLESLDPDDTLAISVHVACELRAGAELSRHPLKTHQQLDDALGSLLIVHPDDRFAPAYGRLLAATHRGGRPVSAMDLLIATAAVLDDAPLVTRNVKDFSRIPGVRVLEY